MEEKLKKEAERLARINEKLEKRIEEKDFDLSEVSQIQKNSLTMCAIVNELK